MVGLVVYFWEIKWAMRLGLLWKEIWGIFILCWKHSQGAPTTLVLMRRITEGSDVQIQLDKQVYSAKILRLTSKFLETKK